VEVLMKARLFIFVLAALCLSAGAAAAEKKPFTTDQLASIKRVAEPALSPDGKWIAFKVVETLYEKNKRRSRIYVVSSSGGTPRALTSGEKGDSSPAWSPDGKWMAFLSSRRGGGSQIYMMPFTQGGEPEQLTSFPGGIDDFRFTPDGEGLVFAARTYFDCGDDLKCIRKKDRRKRTDTVSARVHEHLLYRHWDSYEDGKAQHLFFLPVSHSETPAQPTDITPTLKWDALTYWLMSAGRDFDISPDGKWVYFSGMQEKDQAVSYNYEIFRSPLAGGELEKVTTNPASDMLPRVSPNGDFLAYRATRRPGYESDRYELMVRELETGETRSLTESLDRSVGTLFWSPDGKSIYFEAENQGSIDLYSVDLKGKETTRVTTAEKTGAGYHLHAQADSRGKFFVYLYRTIDMTYEIYRCRTDGSGPQPVTEINKSVYEEYHIPTAEEVWFEGAEGASVHGFLVKPKDFDPGRKYPMMVRVHGGPQQMFGYAFRYEFALFSSAGYFVFFCNPRGSTGYGQEFTDGVRADWGGKPIDDLKAGVRHVLEKYPAIDPAKVGAWGGSYGGYIVNWLQGHNQDKMFAALVSHAGGANRWSAWGTTEELWFPEWEMMGPPWKNPELNDRLSPIRYAEHFSTPQLITHGDLDYRVRVSGGEVMFSALQRRGVPSKMIRFPDENHWIMQPHNQRFWFKAILEWFDQWLK